MEENVTASEKKVGNDAAIKKGNSFTKQVNRKKGNTFSLLNEGKENGEVDPLCIEDDNLKKLLEFVEAVILLKIYSLYKGIESKIQKKYNKLVAQGVHENMIDDFLASEGVLKKASVLHREMIAQGKPVEAVALRDVKIGIELLEKRNHAQLLRKFQKSLSLDDSLPIQLEDEYEALAESVKLPRRTKAIIRKKAMGTGI